MLLSFRKEADRTEYAKKKLHETQNKAKRCLPGEKDNFECIKTMTSDDLLDFINTKYDVFSCRN